MSVESLRNNAIADLNKAIELNGEYLSEGTQQPLEQLRKWQGEIAGLRMAIKIIDERYREMR